MIELKSLCLGQARFAFEDWVDRKRQRLAHGLDFRSLWSTMKASGLTLVGFNGIESRKAHCWISKSKPPGLPDRPCSTSGCDARSPIRNSRPGQQVRWDVSNCDQWAYDKLRHLLTCSPNRHAEALPLCGVGCD